ncbi:PREDICTED: zinc finger CCCH domain-containing protein 20-like [Nicotiana attenuata]|uniref:Zinc finger ccch domain-containing protein 20 n=1 Tax=Nicotiana attenuata TaxID=49451 RepID=A0A1J6JWZ6_NICAT|nr:PREDICTED: zinc finger CCCH domain-containing protein 20-like [Nicotiana attenuata]OIT22277.1 zinc finger ccch domain-containing protein 20 [Nicotiana attenuata]
MMIGERNHPYPTVHIPPWSYGDNQTDNMHLTLSPSGNANSSPSFSAASGEDYSMFPQNDNGLKALQRYLPFNDVVSDFDFEYGEGRDVDLPVDAYSCDQFRMYEFKVRKCARGKSHDWTECPYAHPGEKARRRDPRKYNYSGTACPEFRKGNCRKGDGCEFAHGVFECWLHPARYRTQPCKDGLNCKRRVCFFAHSPEQIRVLSPRADSYVGSPSISRYGFEGKNLPFITSPESGSPPCESPPMSPMTQTTNSVSLLSRSLGSNYSINEMVASLRQLQLNKVKSMPSSWNLQMGSPVLGSPRIPVNRPGFCSLPSTPTRAFNRPGVCCFDLCEEELVMERVESGRDLRAKMFEKLSKENPLDGMVSDPVLSEAPNPDVGWISELIQ